MLISSLFILNNGIICVLTGTQNPFVQSSSDDSQPVSHNENNEGESTQTRFCCR